MNALRREIRARCTLTRADGSLDPDAVGWTRTPLHACPLPGPWGRRKRWNYWCILAPEGAFAITLADLDYFGLLVASFLDLHTGELVETTRVTPFGIGVRLGDRIESVGASCAGLAIDATRSAHATHIRVRSRRLAADAQIERRGDSLGVVVPFGEGRFQYTCKEVAQPASAEIRCGTRKRRIDGFGTLDFGRGLWPYDTRWNWGVAATRTGASTVGVTLGGRWTDGTGATENAIVVDGRLTKIGEELAWRYDVADPRAPWTVRAPRSSAIDLRFVPAHVRRVRVELGIAHSRLVVGFGAWHGTVRTDDGRTIALDGAPGWAEDHHARW